MNKALFQLDNDDHVQTSIQSLAFCFTPFDDSAVCG